MNNPALNAALNTIVNTLADELRNYYEVSAALCYNIII